MVKPGNGGPFRILVGEAAVSFHALTSSRMTRKRLVGLLDTRGCVRFFSFFLPHHSSLPQQPLSKDFLPPSLLVHLGMPSLEVRVSPQELL
jgi:hypothetical protein